MRRFIFLFLLLLSMPVFAQVGDSFTCDNGLAYEAQVTIIPPLMDESMDEIIVTAMSINDYDPVIAVTAFDDVIFCNEAHPDAEIYEAQLDSSNVLSSPLNAQEYVVDEGQNLIQIGEYNAKTGAVLIVLESYIFDTNHQYTLQLTDEMIATGQEFHAYLFAMTGDYTPSLSVSAGDTSLLAEASGAQLATVLDSSFAAVMTPLPMIAGDVQLRVEAGGEGFYALVLELQTGEALAGDAAAEVTFVDDATVLLTCDGQMRSENAVLLNLAIDSDTTVTAIATDELDPILAIVDSGGSGRCFDNTARAESYELELPSIQVNRSFVSAQALVSPDSILIVGADESLSGDYVLVIEGGNIEDGESDVFEVQVTPRMVSAFEYLTAYVFAADDEIDPILTWQTPSGESVVCDNSGVDESCQEASPSLQGTNLILANDDGLIGINLNPMLQIPIDEGMEGTTVSLSVSSMEGTGGDYVLVLHIITD